MNKTLASIVKSREDVSDYLYHFTKGSNAFDTLKTITQSNSIKDVNKRGCICFTEAPLTMLGEMFKIFEKFPEPMYAPYGIAIKKEYLFSLGARPVIYGDANEKLLLDESLRWRFEEYKPLSKDFSWLREWRISEAEISLIRENCFVVTKTKFELEDTVFSSDNIIDVDFDGCVADGGYWGTATGIIERGFKGISIEDIEELNKLSKNELERLLNGQSFDDTSEANLGDFFHV